MDLRSVWENNKLVIIIISVLISLVAGMTLIGYLISKTKQELLVHTIKEIVNTKESKDEIEESIKVERHPIWLDDGRCYNLFIVTNGSGKPINIVLDCKETTRVEEIYRNIKS